MFLLLFTCRFTDDDWASVQKQQIIFFGIKIGARTYTHRFVIHSSCGSSVARHHRFVTQGRQSESLGNS